MGDTVKVWYKSKGLWAGALTMLFGIYSLAQTTFPNAHLFSITGYLPVLFTVLGTLGVYGRLDASGKIVFSETPTDSK